MARVDVAGQSIVVVQAGAALLATPGLLALSPPGVNGNQVSLAWTAPVNGPPATGYLVEASLTPGGPPIAVLPVGMVQALSVPAPHGVYYVPVLARNSFGLGPPSREVQIAVRVALPVTPVLSATVLNGAVSLAWSNPGGRAPPTGFIVEAGHHPAHQTPRS